MKSDKKPKIRFKGFNDEWKECKLGEMGKTFTGLSGKTKEDFGHGEAKFITYMNVFSNPVADLQMMDFIEIDKRQNCVKKGDVFFTTSSETPEDVGMSCVMPINAENIYLNSFCFGYRPIVKFDNNYLAYMLRKKSFRDRMAFLAQGISRYNISKNKVMEVYVPITTLDEQQKIGSFFQTLDNLITLQQHKYDKLINIKKSSFEKMFPKEGETVPKIRFKGFNDEWKECKLGEMGKTFTGLSGKTKEDFGYGEAKFITYMNVFSNPVADLQMMDFIEIDKRQNCVKKGDVFFTTSSETPEDVGMSCVMPINAENIYLNSFCFGYRPIVKFDNNYLAYMLRKKSFRDRMAFLAQGISRYNISKNKVMEVYVPITTLDEQQKIGNYFEKLDNLINLQQQKVEKLKNIKKALLEKMFI